MARGSSSCWALVEARNTFTSAILMVGAVIMVMQLIARVVLLDGVVEG